MVFLSGQVPSITLFCIWMTLCSALVGYVLYTFHVFSKESFVRQSIRYLSFSSSASHSARNSTTTGKDRCDGGRGNGGSQQGDEEDLLPRHVKGNQQVENPIQPHNPNLDGSSQDTPVRPSIYSDSSHSQEQLSSALSRKGVDKKKSKTNSPARGGNTVRFSTDSYPADAPALSYVPPPLSIGETPARSTAASSEATQTAAPALQAAPAAPSPVNATSKPAEDASQELEADESSEDSSLLGKPAETSSALAPTSTSTSGIETRPFTPSRTCDKKKKREQKQRTSLFGTDSSSSDTASAEKSSFSQSFSMRASEFITVAKAKVPFLSILPMGLIFFLNAFATVTVNIVYVYVMYSNITSTALFLVQVSMAFFKLFWNIFVVRKLIEHIPYNKGSIRMHTMMLIFNVLVAPCFASAFTDSACFRDLIFGSDMMTTSYSYVSCLDAYQIFEDGHYTTLCTHYANTEYTTEYNPPFVYNYSCGSSILTSYIPVYIYSYTILALLLPLAFLALSSLPTKYIPLFFLGKIDGIFRPQDRTESAMFHNIAGVADPTRRSSATSAAFVQFQHIFKARSVQASTVQHLAILLTFGITSPVLALVIACAIFVDSYSIQTLMVRYVEYQTKSSVFYNTFNTSGSGSNSSGSVRDSLSSGNISVNSSVTATSPADSGNLSTGGRIQVTSGAANVRDSADRESLSTADGRPSDASVPRNSESSSNTDNNNNNDELIARIYEEERMSELNTICGGTWRALQHTVWLIYYCCIVFYSALLFDVVGDARGLESAISVPISALAVGAFFRLTMSTLLSELHEYFQNGAEEEDTQLEKYKREHGFYAAKMDNFACEQEVALFDHETGNGPKEREFGTDDALLHLEANRRRHSLGEISCAVSNLDIDTLEGGLVEPLIYDI